MNRMIKIPTARVLSALAVALVLGGCAMKGDIRTLQEEMRAMTAQQDSLIRQLRMEALQTQDTLRTQGDQMFDFRGDIARRLQQIEQSLARLEAIAGENQRGMAAVRDQLANLRAGAAPVRGGGQTGTGESESLVGGSGNADELYRVALTQLERGSLRAAEQAFREFIGEHPNDPRAPNAHFYLADILTQQGEPEEALAAFREIPQLFPTAERVPQALFRIALLHEELGDIDEARAVLERIVNTYPDDPASMLARDKLRQIG